MSPKEKLDIIWKKAQVPLPDYKDVIRQAHLEALRQVSERPILDLQDETC